ncbi:VRR-NUC domain protein [Collimonas fungivorans]|uniref:phosphodiesterase I n=1 Tax=Collimonas fungivorans TaxID=158899 RepID=A0A127PBX3_9BURK|nr:VRR-NUC domain-containing protein [Collimonas fungivorans]AMO95253.1 VRR-NUC domain protein [Collimonas fungivorans]
MVRVLENRFYYLDNFLAVVASVRARYRHLLNGEEQAFVCGFEALPLASRALLVRMVMRKGELFRLGRLSYDEIGCARSAVAPLIIAGWLDGEPAIDIVQLCGLLTKTELAAAFPLLPRNVRKAEQLEILRAEHGDALRTLGGWRIDDQLLRLRIAPLCDRLRLMFFGNLHQDWSEFVLSELGIFRYEQVDLSLAQGFSSRQDIDDYLHLHACRERFRDGAAPQAVLGDLPGAPYPNDWLEQRRSKLLFQIAQHYERSAELAAALRIYADCAWPGARLRAIRVLERCGQPDAAFGLAQQAELQPESEAEKQQLLRVMPRLRRQLGRGKMPQAAAAPIIRHDLALQRAEPGVSVETVLASHLSRAGAPAVYVENTLINSLFGLLFWDAVFAPLPGAFFHPFQSGPADLHSADFRLRRASRFDAGFAEIDSGGYRQTIWRNFRAKAGIQSPFVFWEAIDEQLLVMALDCLPPLHLRKCFERILQDIKTNRSGLPDLIQFWPAEKRYQMIEVKGPGDRLQDNQVRWLHYFAEHGMPVAVCYVQWAEQCA